MLEPGTAGEKWTNWHPQHREYASMKKWILSFAKAFDIKPLAGGTDELPMAAVKLTNDYNLGQPLPVTVGQPNAAIFQEQQVMNQRISEALQNMLLVQQ